VDWMQPMRIFVSVVQNGSLSSAGRQLGLSPASVSRHIGALEESLGCRLVNRTSRKLTLTEAGELYFAKVEQILHQIAEANDSVGELQSLPRGMSIKSVEVDGRLALDLGHDRAGGPLDARAVAAEAPDPERRGPRGRLRAVSRLVPRPVDAVVDVAEAVEAAPGPAP